MFKTSQTTAVTSATNLKRDYKKIKDMLKQNMIILVTNKNSKDHVDGMFVPYSELLVERIEDMMEDLEMFKNREKLDKEASESLASGGGKRYTLDEL